MNNTYTSIEQLFETFNRLKVLVVGDVMIDSYLWGKVERISPEAPVPIVNVQKREIRPGGAANVALNLKSLGATPLLVSVVGKDDDSEKFIQLLNQHHIDADNIIRSANRITTIKHRILSGAHHLLRVDQETDSEITPEEKEILFNKIHRLVHKCDVLLFQDYDKGVLTADIIERIIQTAEAAGVPVVVDPKKRNFLAYKNVTLFKPNKKEMREGLKIDSALDTIEDIEHAVQLLKEKISAKNILLTLSEKGVYIQSEKHKHHIPAHVRQIADVSGAGDTVISIAALCVALGLSAEHTAILSNLAGGIVCEYAGVVPIDKDRLKYEAQTKIMWS
ncbi:MAG: bifunctional ADP-heptose synthase [Cytophagaceae bacterium]|nr:bifunctional ADP-heptose synthase [Cytophagaceae bacterium]MDW8455161.1 bifunctional ADP-heptose synthase [Cytophagaceae bacterium]